MTLLVFRAKPSSFKRICHPDRSEAQWRDPAVSFPGTHTPPEGRPEAGTGSAVRSQTRPSDAPGLMAL